MTDGQLPGPGQIFLDHVGWFVPDMDEASRGFAQLGFPLTPYSVHTDRPEGRAPTLVGSANRLAMLRTGYLEILTPVEGADTAIARHMRQAIARGPGVHLLAFTVADAEAEGRRLAMEGFDLAPTVALRRSIEAEDGAAVDVAFTVVRPVPGSIPEGRLQVLTHHTPEHMWQRRYVAQANGISALAGVILVADDIAETAGRLSRFAGRPATPAPEGLEIRLDRGRLLVGRRTAVAAMLGADPPDGTAIAAIELAASDFAAARRHLGGTGDDALVVPAERAGGTALVVRPVL